VIGIGASTLRFLDVFLLHCLLADSPPDTPAEIRELAHNQHLTAARGREPGLCLQRQGQSVPLVQWGLELLEQLQPIARQLDAAHGSTDHAYAVAQAVAALQAPDTLPSARVLSAVRSEHGDSFVAFARAQSLKNHAELLAMPWSAKQQARFEAMAAQSVADQRAIEAADTMPFEIYRQEYTSPTRLGRPRQQAVAA
jgi:glutamate--cysteine ligase